MSVGGIGISERSQALINNPLLNKGTAFTREERLAFDLLGLLPADVESLDQQVARCYAAFRLKTSNLERYIYLRQLQDTNEVLFFRLMVDHVAEMMPVAYTPVVGEACQMFSEIYRRPRGLFLAWPDRDHLDAIIARHADRNVGVIVVTDGERILGLGDQGAGGMGIPIGKLALYTACGGVPPDRVLPILLDVGTNNKALLDDPHYIGWRHERISGQDYLDFVDAFVTSVKRHLPNVLLQWEDFAQAHATPLLQRYRDDLCTFNDDIQGTAAITTGAVIAAVKSAGRRLADERVCIVGGGTAGCGIAEQLIAAMIDDGADPAAARASFYMVDRFGLVHDRMDGLMDFQRRLVQPFDRVGGWGTDGRIDLLQTVTHARPTVMIGVSGQPNLFTEPVVRAMAAGCERPAILPLSNPTSRCEGLPADIIAWSDGRALVATGSPFDPVDFGGRSHVIGQSNNAFIFPAIGLAVLAVGARRISDGMLMKAALRLADHAPSLKTPGASLVPAVADIRAVCRSIAEAVAEQAEAEGLAAANDAVTRAAKLDDAMWSPQYKVYVHG